MPRAVGERRKNTLKKTSFYSDRKAVLARYRGYDVFLFTKTMRKRDRSRRAYYFMNAANALCAE